MKREQAEQALGRPLRACSFTNLVVADNTGLRPLVRVHLLAPVVHLGVFTPKKGNQLGSDANVLLYQGLQPAADQGFAPETVAPCRTRQPCFSIPAWLTGRGGTSNKPSLQEDEVLSFNGPALGRSRARVARNPAPYSIADCLRQLERIMGRLEAMNRGAGVRYPEEGKLRKKKPQQQQQVVLAGSQ